MSLHTLSWFDRYVDSAPDWQEFTGSKRACGVKAVELWAQPDCAGLIYLDGRIFYRSDAEAAAAIPTEYLLQFDMGLEGAPVWTPYVQDNRVWTTRDLGLADEARTRHVERGNSSDRVQIVEREISPWVLVYNGR